MTDKILFITLSNIGDCILSLPVLDALKENFTQAEITVLSGPRPQEIFQDNPNINKLIVFDKRSSIKEKIKLFNTLRKERFDMIIDLRNSFLGAILPAKYKISPFLDIPEHVKHMKQRHLFRLQSLSSKLKTSAAIRSSIYIKPEDEKYINNILKENNITGDDTIIIVAPGARSHIKRWGQDKFVELIPSLIREFGAKIILAGDKADAPNNKYIAGRLGHQVLDLSAKTNIAQLAALLKKSRLVITNDSAILHMAGYLDIPTLAIFGPTNEIKYGPWPGVSSIVKKDIFCRPCEKAQCKFGTLKCLQLIGAEDVLKQARSLLAHNPEPTAYNQKGDLERILIVRTDRIGDVLLSTPVIKAFRDNYPHAYIAMMVSPYGKSVVEDNPYLDEVIVYDKDAKHKSWPRSLKFARNLKKKKFDVAVILHPTNRVHLVTFFAGIPRRVGYDRKLSFLLTDRIRHTKQSGQKHESEYALDLARYLGVEPKDKNIFLSVKPALEERVAELLKEEGAGRSDKLL
ncbi:MAG: glycosyltransferase family 9 protein, partial [Candidatus Omnitrophica bacterium]|nr:glycosyltransferase family 9 protein [Candidatus Omnitrophota bacterium]